MKQRYRLYRRKSVGRFYAQDNLTGKQESLGTTDRTEALRLLHARNEAEHHPAVNLQIARAYLAAGDPAIVTRTCQIVMDALIKTKQGTSRSRYERAMKERAFDSLRSLPVLQTRPEHFFGVLEAGTVSTNDNLRRLHNFALAMTWLPWPVFSSASDERLNEGGTMNTHPVILLEPVFRFLDGIIRDYGLYIYLVMVWLSPVLIAWIYDLWTCARSSFANAGRWHRRRAQAIEGLHATWPVSWCQSI